MSVTTAYNAMSDFHEAFHWLHNHMLMILMLKKSALWKRRCERLRRVSQVPDATYLQLHDQANKALGLLYHVFATS